MNVDYDDKFVLARLEEQVFDVGEQDIDAVCWIEWGLITETILVDFDLSWNTLAVHGGADEDVIHYCWATVWHYR